MEPSSEDRLSDQELDTFLHAWKSPPAPQRLRASVFPDVGRSWWRRLWSASIRVPLPAAIALALTLLPMLRLAVPPAPRVVVRTERIEVPIVREKVVTKTVVRTRVVYAPPAEKVTNARGLRPVAELKPVVMRNMQ